MENFIVSARKYRPDSFSTVVAQESITTTLKNAIKSRQLAHAYLFCGPRGVGKTTCARIFAKTINCANLTSENEACNECESCKSFNTNRSFNIHELDAASNNSVDDIRSLTDQVRIPPQIGKYSIYIIDEVHMLSQQAFNAFLKTLEEPPAHAIFILATTEKHKIIPTILSRCQIFDFTRIKVEDIVNHLAFVAKNENVEAEHEGLNIIAQKADGAMRDALSIFDQIVSFSGKKITYKDVIANLNVLDYDYYFRLVDLFLKNDISNSLLIFNEILNNGFEGHHFINGLSSHLRDLLVCKDHITIQLLEAGGEIKEKYKLQAGSCESSFLFDALGIVNECDQQYKTSQNKRLLVELALIRIAQLTLKKKIADSGDEEILEPIFSEKKEKKDNIIQPEKSKVKNPEKTTIRKLSDKLKGPSIKDALKGNKTDDEKPSVKEQHEIYSNTDDKNDFSEDQLQKKWKEYIEQFSDQPNLKTALLKMPKLEAGYKLILTLENSVQKEALKKIKPEIVSWLRKEMKNSEIRLITKIEEKKHDEIIYTDTEKYKDMLKKNPELDLLRRKFNLDFGD